MNAFWTRETVLDALRRWIDQFGTPPTVTDWSPSHCKNLNEETREKKLRRWKSGKWPAISTVANVFGGWAKMLEAAGLEAPARTAHGTWTRATVVRAIREWIEKHGRIPVGTDWTRAEPGVHPTSTTVYNLFGSWRAGLKAAGFEPPPRRPRPRRKAPPAVTRPTRQTSTPPPIIRRREPSPTLPSDSPLRKGESTRPLPPTKEEPPANTPAANRARVAKMRSRMK